MQYKRTKLCVIKFSYAYFSGSFKRFLLTFIKSSIKPMKVSLENCNCSNGSYNLKVEKVFY